MFSDNVTERAISRYDGAVMAMRDAVDD